MAVTSDYTQINACDNKSDWTGINFSPDDNTSGSPVWAAYEPATARGVSFVASTSSTGSIHEDTNVDMTDKLLVFPLWMVGQEEIARLTILRIRLHEGTGASGDDAEWDQPIQQMLDAGGGWFPLYVWPTQPDAETGTFVPADVSTFEIELRNNDGSNDIKWVIVDDLHWMTEVRISGTTPAIHGFLDISDEDAANFWYVFFKTSGAEQYQSRVRVEIGAIATSTDFREAGGKSLTFLQFNSDQKLYFDFIDGTSGGTDFMLGELSGGAPLNGITVVYDPARFNGSDSSDVFNNPGNCDRFRLYDSTIIGANEVDLPPTGSNAEIVEIELDSGGSGYLATDTLTLDAAGAVGTNCTIDVLTVDGGGAILTAAILNAGDYSTLPTNLAPNSPTGGTGSGASFTCHPAEFYEARSTKFDTCGPAVPGTTRMEDCTVVNAPGAGARITSTSHRTKNNRYIGCVDGIEFTTAGTYTLDGDQFQGNTTDIHHSGSGTVTINAINGANPATSRVSGGGTVVINNTVSVSVTAVDAVTGAAIQNARVLIEAAAGGSLPVADSVTITRVTTTATVAHTAHGLATGDKVVIRGADQQEYNGIKTITVTGANAYTYTVTGSPTTPATGTITSTAVILDGLTNVSGVLLRTDFNFTSSQPLTGKVRKSSASPFYVSGSVVGSVLGAGFSATIGLISDE